jgi:hypothetical protein
MTDRPTSGYGRFTRTAARFLIGFFHFHIVFHTTKLAAASVSTTVNAHQCEILLERRKMQSATASWKFRSWRVS